MLARLRRLGLVLAVPALFATACSSAEESTSSSSDEINYRSTAGQEFDLSTTVTFAVPEEAQSLLTYPHDRALVAALR